MPWVSGQGFEMGLRLGRAKAEQDKEKRYQEERARALQEQRAQDRADAEGADLRLRQIQEKEIGELGPPTGQPAPGQVGPSTVNPEVEQKKRYFESVRGVASRMSSENRERFIVEEQQRVQNAALERARKKVADGIGERVARGAYLFLDESEINPKIDQQLDALVEALDTNQVNPIAAAEMEAKILEAVRKENDRRRLQTRGTAMIDSEIEAARAAKNQGLATQLETLASAWGTQEMEFDDVVDRLFEIQNGRPTARASGPTEFDLRKAALELWSQYEQGPPTEEGLQRYMELVRPAGAAGGFAAPSAGAGRRQPPPTKEQERAVREDAFNPERRGARELEGQFGGQKKQAPPSEKKPGAKEPPPGALAAMRQSAAERSGRAKKEESGGGLPPRPWAKLKPAERAQAEKALLAAVTKGGDPTAAIKAAGFTTIPRELLERLKKAAKAGGKRGKTMGETLAGLRPGAGGM